jgi:hypothetical protein
VLTGLIIGVAIGMIIRVMRGQKAIPRSGFARKPIIAKEDFSETGSPIPGRRAISSPGSKVPDAASARSELRAGTRDGGSSCPWCSMDSLARGQVKYYYTSVCIA